jgi:hypothetical protein
MRAISSCRSHNPLQSLGIFVLPVVIVRVTVILVNARVVEGDSYIAVHSICKLYNVTLEVHLILNIKDINKLFFVFVYFIFPFKTR